MPDERIPARPRAGVDADRPGVWSYTHTRALAILGIALGAAGFMLPFWTGEKLHLYLLVLLGLCCFIGAQVLAEKQARKENASAPVTEVTATVTCCNKEYHYVHHGHSYNTYTLTFQPEGNDEPIEFEVDERAFYRCDEGDVGALKYRTWEFVSFSVLKPAEKEEKP